MSIHHQQSGPRSDLPDVSPEKFPALAAFFGGYLHQDLVPIHGSADRAARAFAEDADAAGREAVRQELQQLIALVRGRGLRVLRRAFDQLGAAWVPSSLAEIEALVVHLRQPDPPEQEPREG